ncbi:MAG: alpha/beta hydrolase, partial [Actinomycetota bacterium]|nr:alpha/beta hydrolase [Actinomycetota bacterium]
MTHASISNADATVLLPDGRRLAYIEWGDRSGPAVLLFHGGGGSRYFNPSVGAEPSEQIRLFTIDRPGFGGSDPQSRRPLRNWARDVSAFADALEIDRFAVVGFSAGGPHALVCGVEIPERLTALGVVSGVAPIPSVEEELDEAEQRLLLSAAEDPVAAVQAYVATLDPAADPTEILRGPLPEVERRFLDDAAIREMYERSLRGHV